MLRFLKWIFLIFGGLAIALLSFFFFQNKHDITVAYDHYDKLQYTSLKKTCLNIKKDYYYPCFVKEFKKYLDLTSLTGMSIGLKMAFNFVELDKENTTFFDSEAEKDIVYSLNYLELNNLAIKSSYKRFFGFEFTYGGFVGKVQDNLEKASAFSNGIIEGLKGKDGITKLNNPVLEEKMHERLNLLQLELKGSQEQVRSWLDIEIKKLEKKYK